MAKGSGMTKISDQIQAPAQSSTEPTLQPGNATPNETKTPLQVRLVPASQRAGLWELISEDFANHGRDWTRPGFRALFAYRFGVWRMGVRSIVIRAPLSIVYRMMFRRARNHYGIELPYSANVGRGVVIEHQGGIVIHGNCEIGDGCYIRQGVTLGNKSLDKPHDAPVLGSRVNVGAGAKVLGNVFIGDDATIGANAVVVKDVPAGATALGIPARIVVNQAPTSNPESSEPE